MVYPFSKEEYTKGIAALKNNKVAGRDDLQVEQLKNIGPKAHKWLLEMEEIENHRHIESRGKLCDTEKLSHNIPSVSHVQTLLTIVP